MKKTILPFVLLIVFASSQALASNSILSGGDPKTSPAVHNILSDKLPAKLLTTIKKDYKSYWITGLYKTDANGKISYHIIVENADQTVELTATHTTNWSVLRVIPKDQTNS
jgi:hypothetical protein